LHFKTTLFNTYSFFPMTAAEQVGRLRAGYAANFGPGGQGNPAPVAKKLDGSVFVQAGVGAEKATTPSGGQFPLANTGSKAKETSYVAHTHPHKEKNVSALSSKAPPVKFNEPFWKKCERENLLATNCK
jgi:hypothetical protein